MGVKVREKIKGSGVYWVFINHNGRRKAKKVGTKKAAEKVQTIIEGRLASGEPAFTKQKPPVQTLNEYYDQRFKERYMRTAITESSRISFESSFKVHTLPELGKLRLDEIDRDKIEDFISVLMGKELAKDSIRGILAGLRILLNNAVEKKIIEDNPARNVGKLFSQAPVRHEEIEPLTGEESLLFLSATLEYEPEFYPPFLCALHTGLRSGELQGLQWSDVDWNSKYIQVSRQVVRGKVTKLKNKHSRRKVDCSDDLLSTLGALKKTRQEEALKNGVNAISEWMFTNDKGDRIDIVNVKTRFFKRVLRKAGLRDIRFHDLRHSFASLLLAQGAPVTYVSSQLGHANPHITMKVYAHWVPNESQREAVNRLPSLTQLSTPVENSQEVAR